MKKMEGSFFESSPFGGLSSFSRGFTLVELVFVMILLGVLAATSLTRLGGDEALDQRDFHDRVVSALRYAQKSAVAARRTVCAIFSSSQNQVSFFIANDFSTGDCSDAAKVSALVGPEGDGLIVKARGSVVFSLVPSTDIVFGASGRPGSKASISIAGLPSALDITVEAETGYVH